MILLEEELVVLKGKGMPFLECFWSENNFILCLFKRGMPLISGCVKQFLFCCCMVDF
jgi:hypothetical protein